MDTNEHKYDGPETALTCEIVGCAMEVLNGLGHGLHEKAYENAVIIELRLKNRVHEQQRRFEVLYKGQWVADYIPDLIVDGRVVVDAKVIDRITDHERGQMLNYLRITKVRVGLIINFKRASSSGSASSSDHLCSFVSICGFPSNDRSP
jgi:GxxExxY protein